MITDEDEEVVSFNLQLDEEYTFDDKDQHMTFCPPQEVTVVNPEEFHTDQPSVYQELAEKDHYLMLAAEAGKVLLEKNQELEDQYQRLQEEYLQKVETLEQERHHLKRELQERDYDYESRMQDLQHELSHLSGQLQTVQKSTRTTEQSNKNNLDDIQIQNNSLLKELGVVKNYNQELSQQVQTLSKRIDGRLAANNNGSNNGSRKSSSGMFPDYDDQDGRRGSHDSVDYEEMRNLKSKVQKLVQEKEKMEASLHVVAHEKDIVVSDHRNTVGKISLLETEILSLKQQIGICQEDLNKTKKKNVKLKDQLEEYVLLQSQNMGRRDSRNNSLFNELEMFLSEVDRNMQNMSTPKRNSDDDDDEEEGYDELPGVFVTTPSNRNGTDKMSSELKTVYMKLKLLKAKLTEDSIEEEDDDDDETENSFTTDMISRLVDEVIHLIQEKILSLGIIDPRMESPRGRDGSEVEEDSISLSESRMSDSEVELLEQKVVELNQRLNIKATECDQAMKKLQNAQSSAIQYQERTEELTVTTNKQEREIDALRKEREILLADTSLEEKLKQALLERDEALKKTNELTSRQEQANSDMLKLNNQLIAAVQQKVELGEQLEAWQNDMASLIHQQLSTQIKKDQKRSRKRTSTTSNNTGKSVLAKLFPNRRNNSSRESSRSNTPQAKSPVPEQAKSPIQK